MTLATALYEAVNTEYRNRGGKGETPVRILRAKNMSEHEIQTTFFDILGMNYSKHPQLRWVYAIPNGGKRYATTAIKLRREGVKAGIWDVHIPIPTQLAPGAWIEFKAGKNKLTEPQREFNAHIFHAGYHCVVCYTVEEALAFVENYLGITLIK